MHFYNLFKRLCASCIVSTILITNTCTLYATETSVDEETNQTESDLSSTVSYDDSFEDSLQEKDIVDAIADSLSSSSSLNTQVDDLYNCIANELNFNKTYIKELNLLAGGQVLYSDKKPNIYTDETIVDAKSALQIDGAKTNWRVADFIQCNNPEIVRPSGYFLPDAVYSVAYDIKQLYDNRLNCNRGDYRIYFDSLNAKSKSDIAFYEAVLLYTGVSEEVVDNFYTAYEKTLYDKQVNENVVEITSDNDLKIKPKFIRNFRNIGITDEKHLNYLAIMLSFDRALAVNDDIENLKTVYVLPYRTNYTSRENMMVASACLVGKVRYVWGGGHSGASYIDGINPVWTKWNSLYPSEPSQLVTNEETSVAEEVLNTGFDTCIKPSGSWCPIHGYTIEEFHGEVISSLDDYINLRKDIFETNELTKPKYREMLSKIDYSEGIDIHTIDGLDCSGFASWLFNQITDKYEINSVARYFTEQEGLKSVEFGAEIYPGDIFAWTEHIVIIVGKVNDNARAFVTVEQTPNVLKYGVIHYSNASQEDIDYAKQIASEANQLIGGLDPAYEEPHVYCMDEVGIYLTSTTETLTSETADSDKEYKQVDVWFPYESEEGYDPYSQIPSEYDYTEEFNYDEGYVIRYFVCINSTSETEVVVEKTEQYREIGRFSDSFIDENTKIEDYDRPIKTMLAVDIIQHTLTKLPISYVTGYDSYSGKLFDKTKVASNLGVEYVYEETLEEGVVDSDIPIVVDKATDTKTDIEVHTNVME